jgi:hypothetical protein
MIELVNEIMKYKTDAEVEIDIKVERNDEVISDVTIISQGNPFFKGDMDQLDTYIHILSEIREHLSGEKEVEEDSDKPIIRRD